MTEEIEAGNGSHQQYSYLERMVPSSDWIILLLLVSTFTIGWIRFFYGKILNQTIKAAFQYRESHKMFNEQNSLSSRISLFLNLSFFINFTLFLFFFFEYRKIDFDDFSRMEFYLVLISSLLLFLFVKSFLYRLLGYLFNTVDITKEYVYNGSLYNKLAGILILAPVIIIAFARIEYGIWMIYTGVFIFLFTYLLQLVRGFQIIFRNNSSLFYTILYLCTIEILPWVIMFKLISRFI